MIGSAGSALISLLQYLSDAPALKQYVLWTMGSFSNVTGRRLVIMAALCLAGLLISIRNIKDLNVFLMGQSYDGKPGGRLYFAYTQQGFPATTYWPAA